MKSITTKRQIILLQTIGQSPVALSRKSVMKLIFLIQKRHDFSSILPFYKFSAFRYGPYSVEVNRDVDKLLDAGVLIADKQESISLTDEAVANLGSLLAKLPNLALALMRDTHEQFGRLSEEELLKLVYTRYPEYAISSEIWDRYLDSKPSVNFPKGNLFTIGYEGDTIDGFLDRLIRAGIDILVDVRRNPLSRKFGFSKTALRTIVEEREIEYLHIPELGIAGQKRKKLETPDDYQMLFAQYEHETLASSLAEIEQLVNLATQKRIALCCFEETHDRCHRGPLAFAVSKHGRMPALHL